MKIKEVVEEMEDGWRRRRRRRINENKGGGGGDGGGMEKEVEETEEGLRGTIKENIDIILNLKSGLSKINSNLFK